jgi:hypothetical protein
VPIVVALAVAAAVPAQAAVRADIFEIEFQDAGLAVRVFAF